MIDLTGVRVAGAILACAAASALPANAQAPRSRPSPAEFRAETASGGFAYDCKVSAPGGANIHRQRNGPVSGRLARNSVGFFPDAAAYDARRRVWYRVPFIYQSNLRGWIRAADVTCELIGVH